MKRFVTGACALLLLSGALPGPRAEASSHPAKKTPVKYVDMGNVPNSEDYVFKPLTLKVKAGTRVTWRNKSDQPHTVTSLAKRPVFDSGADKLIEVNKSWSHTFKKTGTYPYYCIFHTGMKGKIVVIKK